MERVQYAQESSLPALKYLEEQGIFSPLEIKEIIRRRNGFETALIRRNPRKSDYLKYIEYEGTLDRLRKVRVKRLSEYHPFKFFFFY